MRTTVTITGMTCVHCKRAVFTALSGVSGVTSAEVAIGHADIEHDPSVTMEVIREAIGEAGYKVTDALSNRRVLPQLP
jgi:copper chaperone